MPGVNHRPRISTDAAGGEFRESPQVFAKLATARDAGSQVPRRRWGTGDERAQRPIASRAWPELEIPSGISGEGHYIDSRSDGILSRRFLRWADPLVSGGIRGGWGVPPGFRWSREGGSRASGGEDAGRGARASRWHAGNHSIVWWAQARMRAGAPDRRGGTRQPLDGMVGTGDERATAASGGARLEGVPGVRRGVRRDASREATAHRPSNDFEEMLWGDGRE